MRPLIGILGNGHVDLPIHLLLRLLYAHLLPESSHFGQDHFPHLGHILYDLEVEVEWSGTGWFIRSVVPDMQVAMLKRLLNGDSSGWIESQHLIQ